MTLLRASAPRRHRIGFIGFGVRGRSHFQTMLECYPDRVAPVAVADVGAPAFTPLPVPAFGWPEEIPARHRFRDYRDLLALDEVEAVVIATYEATHLEIACAALDAGKAVLLEKAAVVSFAQAEALYRRLQQRPARFQLALNVRHLESVRVVRRLLAEQAIGRVVAVTALVNGGRKWSANAFRRFYSDARLSGDLALSKLTHDSDVLHYLLGTHAETVTGVAGRMTFVPLPGAGRFCRACAITAECPDYLDVFATPETAAAHEARLAHDLVPADVCPYTTPTTSHDTASFTGRYASGAAYSLVFTCAGAVSQRRYHFTGTRGEIVLGGQEGAVVYQPLGRPRAAFEVPRVEGGHGGADPRLIGSFLDYLDGEDPAPVEPEAVLTSVMVPLGGLEAAASGSTVAVGDWYRGVAGRSSEGATSR